MGMIVTNRAIHFLSSKEVPYSLRGQNLATMRRARLRLIAQALGVSPDGSKNDILHRLLARLKASEADKELDPNWKPEDST